MGKLDKALGGPYRGWGVDPPSFSMKIGQFNTRRGMVIPLCENHMETDKLVECAVCGSKPTVRHLLVDNITEMDTGRVPICRDCEETVMTYVRLPELVNANDDPDDD